jgi:hypothetical protein
MAGVYDTLVIFGEEGVYAQSGSYPTQMTSIKKIPNLPGICNTYAFCKYNDPQLGQGIVYVTRTGDSAYFLYVDAHSQIVQYKSIETTENIRGKFKEYLLNGGSISGIRVAYRQDNDSIIVANGGYAWIWQRPDILSGKRPIVKRKLADPDMKMSFLSFPVNQSGTILPVFSLTGIGTTQCIGKFDSTTYKDHQSTIVSNYISGKQYSTSNSRIQQVMVDKINNASELGIAITSTRQSEFGTIPTGLSNYNTDFKSQGYTFQIGLSQTNSAISGINNYFANFNVPIADRKDTTGI